MSSFRMFESTVFVGFWGDSLKFNKFNTSSLLLCGFGGLVGDLLQTVGDLLQMVEVLLQMVEACFFIVYS